MTNLQLKAIVLPEFSTRDLWIADGVIVDSPPADAINLSDDVCYVLPGLVDAHNHIAIGVGGAIPREEQEARAIIDRNLGTLLIREVGSPADTHWVDDREDLPRLIRSGHHLARPKRYLPNFADEIDPEDLVANVELQAGRGDGWVKFVGDWIDRSVGDLTPLWPKEIARAAIERAHELGVRVTAHCFAEQSVIELVDAGIDCIEHGTGLDAETIEKMVEKNIALVPTMTNLENFPIYAGAATKYPTYEAHMMDLYRRRFETIGAAREAGVQIYCGTDAGSVVDHGRVPDEVELLSRIGDPMFALGAASWRAREWLGAEGLQVGDSADLVVYDENPVTNLAVLKHPKMVILRGKVVWQRS